MKQHRVRREKPGLENLLDGIRRGDTLVLSRAITLVESRKPEDRQMAQRLLHGLSALSTAGQSLRLAITGSPGVGKSTFIDALGMHLRGLGLRVAVLAIDPSSSLSQGSILGDKTRMERLSQDPGAYIRPSPSGLQMGGVTHTTYESILLCEAAGYDVILIETVGVGQSEIAAAGISDLLVLLVQPGAGDDLQGIKRGIMEMADIVLVNKADGDLTRPAKLSLAQYQTALHLFAPRESGLEVPVLPCSAAQGKGIPEAWEQIRSLETRMRESGYLVRKRGAQRKELMEQRLRDLLESVVLEKAGMRELQAKLERQLETGDITPAEGASKMLEHYLGKPPGHS